MYFFTCMEIYLPMFLSLIVFSYIFHGLLLLRARWVSSVTQGPAEDDRITDTFFSSVGEKHL